MLVAVETSHSGDDGVENLSGLSLCLTTLVLPGCISS